MSLHAERLEFTPSAPVPSEPPRELTPSELADAVSAITYWASNKTFTNDPTGFALEFSENLEDGFRHEGITYLIRMADRYGCRADLVRRGIL